MDPKKEAESVYSEVELEDNAEAEAVPAIVPVEVPVTPPVKEEPKVESKDDEEPETPEPVTEPVSRKRSIYQDLKEKKNEVKTERELRETAERERDEALAKLNDPDKKVEADDIEAFAAEIDASPDAIRRMKELFLKDLPKGELSPELAAQLKEFQEFQAQNRESIDKVQFDKEFEQATPAIRTMLGEASAEETTAIKAKLTELAHTEQYHDKELDYIAFKNQEVLKALVSPKKRGLESKGRTDATHVASDFDPNADMSKMSEKESIAWEEAYKNAGKAEGLAKDTLGRSILI